MEKMKSKKLLSPTVNMKMVEGAVAVAEEVLY
jgi:hypothetical protein